MLGALRRMFDPNVKEVRRLQEMVEVINNWEPDMQALSDAELAQNTVKFRERLERGESLDELLPEAFATVREAAKRTLGQRHYDVQLMGGIALHEGRIAEMRTGEGKTLAATLPVYLNALTGRGVHVVTVNDYLAKRDAEWMGAVYRFLGLTVGTIVHGKDFRQRREAYVCDVTYGTNNEFGFDYLRDNMVLFEDQMVQRPLYYAIVDEVDSILIDEARTPLIISGMAEESTEHYYQFAQLVKQLKPEEDYTVDEKARQVAVTEAGVAKVERMLGVENLYDDTNFRLTHYLNQALKAKALFERDRDYVVNDGEVVIVDEFTGRMMPGRRYSDGLHQAIEAKEGVKIERESQTLASITFQNYFRMYEKLAGMTGTAKTEEEEFRSIYGMDVVTIPTHREMVRVDHPDVVYKTEKAKFDAVVEEIVEFHKQGRPVLVGTVSIEKSERLSNMLKRRGVPHQVLNAKYHEREAEIIAQAGKLGAVTIATNMAGRGTDILLGGNPEFLAKERMRREGYSPEEIQRASEEKSTLDGLSDREREAHETYHRLFNEAKEELAADAEKVRAAGGLHILGTERHESRRIDNQLRGRAGRQGDPGSSRFYLSLEDDLMRLFGSQRISSLVERLGWPDDEPLEHNQLSKAIENAQKKVEARNFEIRKQVLQYDDVLNKQREVIYEQRRKVLRGENLKESMLDMLEKKVDSLLDTYCDEKTYPEEWDIGALLERMRHLLNRTEGLEADRWTVDPKNPEEARQALRERLLAVARAAYDAREAEWGPELMRAVERHQLLTTIDEKWMAHLRDMDDLREGIGLRAYGQRQPLLEYQFEGYEMFQQMMDAIQEDVLMSLFRIQVVTEGDREPVRRPLGGRRRDLLQSASTNEAAFDQLSGGSLRAGGTSQAAAAGGRAAARAGAPGTTVVQRRVTQRVGRNDPCPCGSGKKYKRCCALAEAQ